MQAYFVPFMFYSRIQGREAKRISHTDSSQGDHSFHQGTAWQVEAEHHRGLDRVYFQGASFCTYREQPRCASSDPCTLDKWGRVCRGGFYT